MTRIRRADVVIIGAGPAGLAAAVAAAEGNRSVLVIDQGMRAGGQVWRHREEGDLPTAARGLLRRARELGVRFMMRSRLLDASSPGELVIDFNGRADRHQAGALILALGARERFLPFPGWTLPGVTGVGGLQALIKGGLPLRGSRVVIAGTGPLLLPVAAATVRAGGELLLLGEQAPGAAWRTFARKTLSDPAKLFQAIRYRRASLRTPYRTDTWVVRAEGTEALRAVVLHSGGGERTIPCDWLATAAGLVPNVEAAALFGCAVAEDAIVVDPTQATTVPGVWAAGECTGVKGDGAAIVEGEIAGRAASGDATGAADPALQRARRRGIRFGALMGRTFAPRAELRTLADDQTILCRCEDVRRGAVDPAWSQRQAKLWTRIGMGACQGAVCGPMCQTLFNWEANRVRPPLGSPTCAEWATGLASLE